MKPSYTRIFAGLGVILLGSLLLLDTLSIKGFDNLLGTWWPLFIIGAGVLALLNNPKNYLWAGLVIGFGAVYQLNTLGVATVNPWQLFWPAIIIVIGFSIIFRQPSSRARVSTSESDDVSAILGGANQTSKSEDYKGGKVTSIMGGVEIDLRKCVIKNEATLDIFALMGGVEIRVPENVVVKTKAVTILGGIENKSQPSETKHAPVLYLTGDVIMAGVEVKR